jgi:hypothetical protein
MRKVPPYVELSPMDFVCVTKGWEIDGGQHRNGRTHSGHPFQSCESPRSRIDNEEVDTIIHSQTCFRNAHASLSSVVWAQKSTAASIRNGTSTTVLMTALLDP